MKRWLWGLLKPHLHDTLRGLIAAMAGGVIGTLDPLLMRHLIDQSLPQEKTANAFLTVLLLSMCLIGRSVLVAIDGMISFRIGQLLGNDLREDLLSHMTSLPFDWHQRLFLGEKISRLEKDAALVSQFVSEITNALLRPVVFFTINLAIMFAMSWKMTLAVLPLLPLFLLVRSHFRPLIQLSADRTQQEQGKASSSLTEYLAGLPQIQLLGAEGLRLPLVTRSWVSMVSAQLKQKYAELAFSLTTTTILSLAILLVLAFGVNQVLSHSLSVGSLVAFYSYSTRLFEPLSTAIELYARSQRMVASAKRVMEIFDTTSTVPDKGTITALETPLRHGISMQSVRFLYGQKVAIEDLTLFIRPGERIAIAGKSGCGKSTVARLLARVADPVHGEILLDGTPLNAFALGAVRDMVCYVPQQPVLFSGTIRDNLLYAAPNATKDDILRALHAAQLAPFLERCQRGLDTDLGPEAAGLSGGERQRLALARALLRPCSVLILDEATSALDLPTEIKVFQSISNYRRGMTLIMISHHLKALSWVDRFIVLDSGTLAAEGTPAALYRTSALYRSLYDGG